MTEVGDAITIAARAYVAAMTRDVPDVSDRMRCALNALKAAGFEVVRRDAGPPPDVLRERIARALYEHRYPNAQWPSRDSIVAAATYETADAVLAVVGMEYTRLAAENAALREPCAESKLCRHCGRDEHYYASIRDARIEVDQANARAATLVGEYTRLAEAARSAVGLYFEGLNALEAMSALRDVLGQGHQSEETT